MFNALLEFLALLDHGLRVSLLLYVHKVAVSEHLTHLWHVMQVAVMQDVIVVVILTKHLELVFFLDPGCVGRHNSLILILFQDHSAYLRATSTDSPGQNRAIYVGFEKGGPPSFDEHETHVLFQTIIGSPVEDVQVFLLRRLQFNLIRADAGQDFLLTVRVGLEILPKLRVEGLGGHFAQGCAFIHSRHAHLNELALGSIIELLLDDRRLLLNNSLGQMLTKNFNDRLITTEASNVNRSVLVGVEDLSRPIF